MDRMKVGKYLVFDSECWSPTRAHQVLNLQPLEPGSLPFTVTRVSLFCDDMYSHLKRIGGLGSALRYDGRLGLDLHELVVPDCKGAEVSLHGVGVLPVSVVFGFNVQDFEM